MSELPEINIDTKMLKKYQKDFGNIVRDGNDVFEEVSNRMVLPLSPALDLGLGGGLVEGSWVLFTGDEKTGKSTTALQFAANCQREENGSRHTIYLDVEGRLKGMNLTGIEGLDLDKTTIICSDEEALPAEHFLSLAESYLKNNERLVLIIDSISNLIPLRDLVEDLSGERRPGVPKLLSNFTKRMAGIVPRKKHVVIMITHFIADLSFSMKTKISDGGRKIRYQADTIAEITHTKDWKIDNNTKKIGQLVNWKVLSSAAGGYPGTTCTSALKYGTGLDGVYEIIKMAIDFNIIKKSGSWFSADFLDKVQGEEKLYDYLKENKDVFEEMQKRVYELIG